MQTAQQQKQFFDTFGYLLLPGLVADDIDWITREFEAVFTEKHMAHDATRRTSIVPFIDQNVALCSLLDHPRLHPILANILGEDFNYLGGDGNYYTGDTLWHSDGIHLANTYLKVAFYLDPVSHDTGALRVIPGSHRVADQWSVRQVGRAEEQWGIAQREVPAIALAAQPGDVVLFNHNIMHASFGGSTKRRMFTMNCCTYCQTSEEIADLEQFIHSMARFWIDSVYSNIMVSTASEQRMHHLQQVLKHETALPALSAKVRAETAEPSRH